MATRKKEGGLLKGNKLPAHGPIGEGRDPLTLGETTYGEDVKGASVEQTDTAGIQDEVVASEKLTKEQKMAQALADKEAKAAADKQ